MAGIFGRLSSHLCFLARVGAFAGAAVGAMFDYVDRVAPIVSVADTALAGGVATLLAWIATLVVFGVWLRYTVRQIWLSTLVVSALTGVAVVSALSFWSYGFTALLGLVIGAVVGGLLCLLCRLFAPKQCAPERAR